jgi:hypothetical protein
MGVSRTLNLGCHTPIHLNRLELREQLVHRQGVILLRLYNGFKLSDPNLTIQRVQELDGSIMIIVRGTSTLALMLFTTTVNRWNKASMSHLFSEEKPSASHMCTRISLHTYDRRNE